MDWRDLWLTGKRYHRAISFYIRKKGGKGDPYCNPILAKCFQTYETHIHDPKTGMPMQGGCKDSSYAMAGLFKAIRANFEADHAVPNTDKAINLCLICNILMVNLA